ncbi:RNA polymerase sigma factor [Streptomyces sp. NBC_00859]|uniref:RNA polymerase sigma factor n=1 Tax=Streptomyces sp. NBC_00859 TaxID=2903682 RepID=UPI00386978DA|nr:sigma-70 family RNA polymerase sigma factor [Streptomyces sp. NBC_00859]
MKHVRTREGSHVAVADEAEVIARVRAGDAQAYAELVRAYTGIALRAAAAFGAGADAEDVVQSAFFKAYRALDRFKPGAAFRPWLLRIVMNETRNALRSAVRLRSAAGREAALSGAEPLIPESADPAAAVLREERRTLLLAALDRLSAEQRLVVTYRYLLEMDEAETAEALGWPRGTVKSRLNRALKKLSKLLPPPDGEVTEVGQGTATGETAAGAGTGLGDVTGVGAMAGRER